MFDKSLIEKFNNQETPFYYYDLALLDATLHKVNSLAKKYQFDIHYAVKANSNKRILNAISAYGLGADCVSGNEITAAMAAGFKADKILFAGVGKTDKEILQGLNSGIKAFNCESIEEIEVINQLAGQLATSSEIFLRINPDVDAKTHKYITTGLDENKFGINQQDLPDVLSILKKCSNIKFSGLHFHIGSQITSLDVFKGLCLKVNQIADWFYQQGIKLKHLNLGGGLGVDYANPDKQPIADFENYFAVFNQLLNRQTDQTVHFELGRSIVAQSGSLITRVVYTKKGLHKNFVIVDAGMTELLRPALYQSYHQIDNLSAKNSSDKQQNKIYDVVGPICESSDCFAKSIALPQTQRGDIMAIRSAGAYGEVMMSNYNLRDKNPAFYAKAEF